ncbi:MAG TPA: acyl-ACP--UDP-N-acetylglucosamine O-acyltransferase [Deltaproteobacteria bacterium]|nr:acyl-ACP--UDP-N-acetylglucosamine O-acyltransferase [Deltaproteobacteria bacterium]
MAKIDPTALIADGAELADDVVVGPYATIGERTSIGAKTTIGPYCMIRGPAEIGGNCTFTGYASIGTPPQDHSYRGEDTRLVIGENNTIREFVTINRGTVKDRGVTSIGNNNLIMAYCHVAHDCVIGNHVVMGNLATLAGHVKIQDHAIIGGLSAIHQFTRIGAYAIIGGGSMVSLDIVPYARAAGDRARLFGVNSIGLKRNGFRPDQIKRVEKAYRTIFKQGLLLKDAIEALRQEITEEEIRALVEFLSTSTRGIAR